MTQDDEILELIKQKQKNHIAEYRFHLEKANSYQKWIDSYYNAFKGKNSIQMEIGIETPIEKPIQQHRDVKSDTKSLTFNEWLSSVFKDGRPKDIHTLIKLYVSQMGKEVNDAGSFSAKLSMARGKVIDRVIYKGKEGKGIYYYAPKEWFVGEKLIKGYATQITDDYLVDYSDDLFGY